MNEPEFIELFKSILDNPNEEIDMDTEFRYLDDWSSLAGVSFIAEVKNHLGKTITVADFKNAETLRDLYNLLNG